MRGGVSVFAHCTWSPFHEQLSTKLLSCRAAVVALEFPSLPPLLLGVAGGGGLCSWSSTGVSPV